MKALTLLQPWASLMVRRWHPDGRFCKKFETRSYRTKYRGPIAIHSSASYPKGIAQLVCSEPFMGAFGGPVQCKGPAIVNMTPLMPTGVVLGIGNLVECLPVTECIRGANNFIAHPKMTFTEKFFGDYTPGRFAWLIEDMKPFKTPVPAKGMLGLWEWEKGVSVEALIERHCNG